jgi:hypothetical protein
MIRSERKGTVIQWSVVIYCSEGSEIGAAWTLKGLEKDKNIFPEVQV